MKKTTALIALALAMIAAPVLAIDIPADRPLQGFVVWVLGLFDASPAPADLERLGPHVRQKLGPEAIPDGSAVPVAEPPINDGAAASQRTDAASV